jgi:excisionase family DNA binding protein
MGGVMFDKLLVNVVELSGMLGVSERTVWSMVKRGELPYVRLGKRVLFPVDEVRECIKGLVIRPDANLHLGSFSGNVVTGNKVIIGDNVVSNCQ